MSVSCSIRQNLHPVNGSYDPSAVPTKSHLLWHAQPGRLRWRAHRRSLVVFAAAGVSASFITLNTNITAYFYLQRTLFSFLCRVVTEDCYPYAPPQQTPVEVARCMMQSRSVGRGKRQATQRCPNTHTYQNDIYQSTPPYRLSSNVSTAQTPNTPNKYINKALHIKSKCVQ